MKFYPADWQSDERLGMCTLAARGLWMEMLALMHKANPYGHLLVNGMQPSDEQIAALARAPTDQARTLIQELEQAGVFSRTRNGTIYSRRMTKDEKRRKDGKKTANEGTLPTSRRGKQVSEKSTEKLPPPGVDDRVVEQPPSYPEARGQSLEDLSSLRSDRESARSRASPARDLADFRQELSDLDPVRLDALIKLRRKKNGQLTAYAARLFKRDAQASGLSLPDAVDTCISRNWITVRPDWLQKGQGRLQVVSQPAPPDDEAWAKRMDYFLRHREWHGDWGPRPGQPGCKVPDRILEEFRRQRAAANA
jgi:hypothetical protein